MRIPVLSVFLCLGVLPLVTNAQVSYPYDSSRITNSPLSAYEPVDVDNIDLGNGNLRIRIPLFHLPGRGLDTHAEMIWDSKLWYTTTGVADPTVGTYWANTSRDPGGAGWPAFGWKVGLRGFIDSGAGASGCDLYVDPNTGVCGTAAYQEMSDDEGNRLVLSSPDGINYWASDGTYALINSSGTFYKNGHRTLSGPGSTSINEDANGNRITCNTDTSLSLRTCTDTLGRTITFSGNWQASGTGFSISYLDSSGTSQTFTFAYHIASVTPSSFATANNCNSSSNPFSAALLDSVTLPNQLKYQFLYNSAGELTKILLPAGGYIRYTYTGGGTVGSCIFSPPSSSGQGRGISSRIVSSDGTVSSEKTWTYSAGTVTDPIGNKKTVTFHYDGVIDKIEYASPSGSVLRRETMTHTCHDEGSYRDYVGMNPCSNPRYLTRTVTLPDTNKQSQEVYTYGSFGNLIERDEYDWGVGGPGALVRKTTYTYLNDSNSAYAADSAHILDRRTSEIVDDAGGCARKQTAFAYDGTSPAATSGVIQHDYTGFPSTYNLRGNLTQASEWLGSGTTTGTCSTAGSWLNTAHLYNDAGDLTQTTDPRGYSTSFSYSDNFYNFTPTSPTLAFVTQTTFPSTNSVSHVQRRQYYFNSGLAAADCGQNFAGAACNFGLAAPQADYTTYTYDLMNRRLILARGDGGQNSVSYNDASAPITITSTTKINSTTNFVSQSVYDGLGRLTQTQLNSDPDCPSGDKTDTTYDGLGRVYTISNPYCTRGDLTYGITTYNHDDALGRTTKVTNPDNSTMLITYQGNATQVQDEGNGIQRVTRISQIDGLGRLASVCEVSSAALLGNGGTPSVCGLAISGTGFLTTYQYDALDNLTSVSMSGLNPRSFAYDSLSRLTSATNPESGQICYGTVSAGVCQSNGYDANGNLVTKTDARGITTSFSYDALNRLTGKTYSDGTPAATFNYDQSSALGVALTNSIGRKSSQSTAGLNATGSVFGYDAMGRISNNSQCTPQNCGTGVFAFQYTQYDFVGDLFSATNATGVTFTYAYNTVARLTGITSNFVDSSHPGTLFSNAHYSPFGSLTGAALGNGVTESWSYNNRGWQQSGTATFGSTTPYSFSVATFAPNGDILAANDSVNGNWVYKFDDFDRLVCSNLASNGTCATPTSGTPTYTYDHDRFGNRWHQNGPQSSQLSFDANNRIMGVTGVGYDLGGNLTSDGSGPGAHRYFYDAENRIIQLDGTLGSCSTATACYVYNADGQRVRKTTGGSSMDYLYDLAGHKVADVDPTGVFMQGELYAGDRHFAIFAPAPGPTGATFFTHSDWLGTERARTDMTGTNCESITSLPYGDGQSITGTCGDVSPMHFTGKERDSESGNDDFGARYYSSSTGRWLSPDILNLTSARLVNPSNTLNKYAYGADNPLKYIDRDGEDITIFYRPPSGTFNMDFGHIFIGVVNQNTQQAGFLDFYPTGSVDSAGKGPGAINKGNMQDRAAQAQAGQFATLTIRTTPEAAQKVLNLITALQKGDAPGYAALSKNCTTICEDVLHDLGLDFGDILPQSYFLDAVSKFNPQALYRYTVRDVPVLPMAGIEYGNPRNVGMNYNSWLFQLFLNQFQNQQSRPPQNPAPPKPAAKCPLCPL